MDFRKVLYDENQKKKTRGVVPCEAAGKFLEKMLEEFLNELLWDRHKNFLEGFQVP